MTSHTTLRLCELLASWPRQVINSWIFSGQSAELKLVSREHPPMQQKRRQKLVGFLPEHVAEKTQVLSILDDEFPALLRMIPDPPLVLFYLGDPQALANRAIAIVGARKCTTVGKVVAERFAADLAHSGVCTISGLAHGIDAAAHKGALAVGAGRTVAFLGAGLSNIYPRQNKYLGEKIVAQGGMLISEYPYQTQPRPYHFPERNRLISGAAWATIMVEASEQSGSLITARMALEQGREVFAVPGSPLSEVSKGCHRMIRQGAVLVTDVAQVMEEMDWTHKVDYHPKQETTNLSYKVPNKGLNKGSNSELNKEPVTKLDDEVGPKLSPVSQRVLRILSPYAMSLDEISLACSDDIQNISQSLVELQLAGFVQQRLGGYIRVS